MVIISLTNFAFDIGFILTISSLTVKFDSTLLRLLSAEDFFLQSFQQSLFVVKPF